MSAADRWELAVGREGARPVDHLVRAYVLVLLVCFYLVIGLVVISYYRHLIHIDLLLHLQYCS